MALDLLAIARTDKVSPNGSIEYEQIVFKHASIYYLMDILNMHTATTRGPG